MSEGIPIYVTRKDATGRTGTWSVTPAAGAVVVLLALANLVLWLAYGAYEAAAHLLGLL